jgi:PAS domain S-box-containing protein
MFKKKRPLSLDTLKLSNPHKVAVAKLLAQQKNKYKKLLHEAHERIHIIADLSSSLEFWYNVNGSYEFVSPACASVLGYPREAFLHEGLRLEALVHPDDSERFRKDKARALLGESDSDVEYVFLAKDGTSRWMLMTWSPVITRRGRHIGVRISLEDITAYKQCQYFSNAYRRLMLTISDELKETAIVTVNPEGEIQSWNTCATKLFGYTRDEMLGRDFIMLFGTEVDLENELPDFATLGCEARITQRMTFHPRKGSDFIGDITFLALCDHTGALHLVTCLIPLRGA